MVVYFDNILIYSKDEREHQNHLNQIMMVLEREKLFSNLKKCTFFSNEMTFLGYILTAQGIKANESMVGAIRTWPIPQSIDDVRSFHGLASFYKLFIRNIGIIMAPTTKIINGTSFIWSPNAQSSFEEIKTS